MYKYKLTGQLNKGMDNSAKNIFINNPSTAMAKDRDVLRIGNFQRQLLEYQQGEYIEIYFQTARDISYYIIDVKTISTRKQINLEWSDILNYHVKRVK